MHRYGQSKSIANDSPQVIYFLIHSFMIALRCKAKNRNEVMFAKFSQRFLGSICGQTKQRWRVEAVKLQSKKAQQNTVVGETARMTQGIQTSCHQEHISSDFQSQET